MQTLCKPNLQQMLNKRSISLNLLFGFRVIGEWRVCQQNQKLNKLVGLDALDVTDPDESAQIDHLVCHRLSFPTFYIGDVHKEPNRYYIEILRPIMIKFFFLSRLDFQALYHCNPPLSTEKCGHERLLIPIAKAANAPGAFCPQSEAPVHGTMPRNHAFSPAGPAFGTGLFGVDQAVNFLP